MLDSGEFWLKGFRTHFCQHDGRAADDRILAMVTATVMLLPEKAIDWVCPIACNSQSTIVTTL